MQERGSRSPSRESRALSSAWASLRPKTVPGAPVNSCIRFRPEDNSCPSVSATTAPMGREPARYASQASSTHARQGSESISHTNGMVPSREIRRTRSGAETGHVLLPCHVITWWGAKGLYHDEVPADARRRGLASWRRATRRLWEYGEGGFHSRVPAWRRRWATGSQSPERGELR